MRLSKLVLPLVPCALAALLLSSAAECAEAAASASETERVLADVQPDAMWSIVESFSKIDRTSSSAGERRAAGQLQEALTRLGVPQRLHEIRAYLSIPGPASLEILAPERFAVPVITPSFSASTAEGGLRGPLAYVGPRDPGLVTTRPEDFRGIDARERILLLRGYPSPELIELAERAGASGAICIAPAARLVNMIVSSVWGSPTPSDAERFPRIPIVTVNQSDGARLEALSARGGVTAHLEAQTDTGWKTLPLLVAEIRGALEPERFVLIANHLDSWHEGVTDSATGNGALLEIARVVQAHRGSLRRSLRIAWWPGHSTGRYAGSTWYADHFFDDLHDNGVAYMAIDSPGVRNATALEAEGMFEAKHFLESTLAEQLNTPIRATRNFRYNDESFWGIGLPSLTLYPAIPHGHPDRAKDAGGSAYGAWWHTREDTLDKADRNLLVRDTRLYLSVLWPLLTRERLPFDFAPVARQMGETIESLSAAAAGRFDFGPTLRRIEAFETAASALGARVSEAGSEALPRLNEAQMAISRLLNPVLYTCAGPFSHDPAVMLPLFPCLRDAERLGALDPVSDAAGFIQTALLRESNRIHRALEAATRAAREAR